MGDWKAFPLNSQWIYKDGKAKHLTCKLQAKVETPISDGVCRGCSSPIPKLVICTGGTVEKTTNR